MGLVLTKVRGPIAEGHSWLNIWSVAFDSSYPVGGEALALADLGFGGGADIDLDVRVDNKSGYTFEYDYTNHKLLARTAIKKYTAAVNPASMATDAVSSLAVTVTGVLATDVLLSIQPAAALEAGLVVQSARVTGADTVTVELSNTSAGTVDGASLSADFYVIRANGAAQEVPDTTDLSAVTGVRLAARSKYLG